MNPINNHLAIGTTNLINKLGDALIISTYYITDESASINDDTVKLKEVDGLFTGALITIKEKEYKVIDILGKVIKIDPPLSDYIPYESPIFCKYNVKGIPVPRFKRITYELLEFLRKVRVPQETVVTYGSIVTLFQEQFFVVGLDPGDYSYSLTLREINTEIDISRIRASEEVVIARGVPAHIRYDRADLPLREGVGYLPTGYFYCMIPKNYPITDPKETILSNIRYEDRVISEEVRYRVVGFDNFTHKNFLALILSYDLSK